MLKAEQTRMIHFVYNYFRVRILCYCTYMLFVYFKGCSVCVNSIFYCEVYIESHASADSRYQAINRRVWPGGEASIDISLR